MNSLNNLSICKSPILASTPPNNTSPSTKSKAPIPKINTLGLQKQLQKKSLKQQPSVAEIERAVGAGIFRDRDTERVSEENKTLFDSILSNSIGKSESSVEKKLRETGEWITHQTESTSRSAGKQILMFVFLWVIPMWITAFLVASGIIELPFSTPFLDDLIL